MKGIVLAGGAGTRLYPLTRVASKQLQPIYDKPMIYYPLSTLMLGGIREVLLISTPEDVPRFQELLGDGRQWGMNIEYCVQDEPRGIAEALILGESFVGDDNVALILGDNVFYGNLRILEIVENFSTGALVFGYYVNDPTRYGVVDFDADGNVLSIEEKPATPRTNYAVPGLYLYDSTAAARARALEPSPRGELEITDLNLAYLSDRALRVQLLGRGLAWLDTGTHASLLDAAAFIGAIQTRQGLKIACLEEIAYVRGFIDRTELNTVVDTMPNGPYREYLEQRFANE
ncbi:MAG: glucose-1-phosphate thymidylyltransferase RfbA [Lentisphaeria bacterium]|jgi:glucose-1-phosphate thymidylyltransferase|nr:glucose-1-phosphate thymidylyltransferase RfbA [Lentisphaeria bacterium]MDP7739943.1 glucose-1-phosphate thymidylyltransferase RfbA [Lentisphaeria bacterium]